MGARTPAASYQRHAWAQLFAMLDAPPLQAPAHMLHFPQTHCSHPAVAPLPARCSCVLMCHTPKKEYYKKFLFEPLPGGWPGLARLCVLVMAGTGRL